MPTQSAASQSRRVLAIVGVGLLGGSVAAAARQRGLVRRVIGIGRNEQRLRAAQQAGLIDSYALDPRNCDADWDFAVIGTPVDRIAADVREIAAVSRPGTLITDVGSVKAPICRDVGRLVIDDVEFAGSHPLAGSEKRGFEAARADLFENRVTVVTPCPSTPADATARVKDFWESLGSRVVEMSPDAHDQALARTSHLPHLVAAALAAMLEDDQRQLTATGYRDTTRIASGDPDLWVAILLSNAPAVSAALQEYSAALVSFAAAIQEGDSQRLKMLLQDAKTRRDAL